MRDALNAGKTLQEIKEDAIKTFRNKFGVDPEPFCCYSLTVLSSVFMFLKVPKNQASGLKKYFMCEVGDTFRGCKKKSIERIDKWVLKDADITIGPEQTIVSLNNSFEKDHRESRARRYNSRFWLPGVTRPRNAQPAQDTQFGPPTYRCCTPAVIENVNKLFHFVLLCNRETPQLTEEELQRCSRELLFSSTFRTCGERLGLERNRFTLIQGDGWVRRSQKREPLDVKKLVEIGEDFFDFSNGGPDNGFRRQPVRRHRNRVNNVTVKNRDRDLLLNGDVSASEEDMSGYDKSEEGSSLYISALPKIGSLLGLYKSKNNENSSFSVRAVLTVLKILQAHPRYNPHMDGQYIPTAQGPIRKYNFPSGFAARVVYFLDEKMQADLKRFFSNPKVDSTYFNSLYLFGFLVVYFYGVRYSESGFVFLMSSVSKR